LQAKRVDALEVEARNLNQSITRRAQEEVFAIARKTLADLASASLEERIGEVFIQRVRTMDGKVKESLGEALKTDAAPAVVRSTFDLGEEQRAAIQRAINETFSAEIRLRYETTPDLVCGIELTSNGQKLEWSIANYLTLMEKSTAELIKKPIQAVQPKELLPETKTLQPVEAKLMPKPKDSEHAA
jgi:F-type H+-transporting ATPase subunit b